MKFLFLSLWNVAIVTATTGTTDFNEVTSLLRGSASPLDDDPQTTTEQKLSSYGLNKAPLRDPRTMIEKSSYELNNIKDPLPLRGSLFDDEAITSSNTMTMNGSSNTATAASEKIFDYNNNAATSRTNKLPPYPPYGDLMRNEVGSTSLRGSSNYGSDQSYNSIRNENNSGSTTTLPVVVTPDNIMATNIGTTDDANSVNQKEGASVPSLFEKEEEEEDPAPMRSIDYKQVSKNNYNEIMQMQKTSAKNPRKFVRYDPSEWEKLWLQNIDEWQNKREICEVMYTEPHMSHMHQFLNLTCTHRFGKPFQDWCLIDDSLVALWYNSANKTHYDLHWEKPEILKQTNTRGVPLLRVLNKDPLVVYPQGDDVDRTFSKFIYKNEVTGESYAEYIEPLVSHLRWPLAHCFDDPNVDAETYKYHGSFFRGWIVPPPPTNQKPGKKYLFDAGASDWNRGAGGPSLNYFTKKWSVQGFDFDSVNAYEMVTDPETFYESVPLEYRGKAHYQKCAVSSQPEDHSKDHPFLPIVIKETTTEDDYVLFKLDIDSPQVESGNIDYILRELKNININSGTDSTTKQLHIDELFWEHHISGNYLMTEWGDPSQLDSISLRESYYNFLQMRQKGIRAHSWV